ncbi:MAG: N-acetylmuramoyl-L-alanine amidase [Firmicutes bacterium]|nr:N-acetylmuramoyl-L-alanine amidase [Bacillota bacterium]
MPRVFLSPSQEDFNPTVLGVNEKELMRLIADAMEPLLHTNGIEFQRVRDGATMQEAINAANAYGADVYLGIHSNASPTPGAAFGNRNYFWETSTNGRRLAQDIADEFSRIYYEPSRATIVPNRNKPELQRTRMPAVMSYTAFHDNEKDARWIQTNIQNIAQAYVKALVRYFGLTYVAPCTRGQVTAEGYSFRGFRWATVCTTETAVNIRNAPNGPVMFTLPRNTQIIVTGAERDGFTPIRFDFWNGWASSQFICICRNEPQVTPPVFPPIYPEIPPVMPIPPIGTIPPTTPPPAVKIAQVRTHGSNLNLRQQPSLRADIIAQMPNGSHLLILGEQGDWYYVFWNRHLGWASKEWIHLS